MQRPLTSRVGPRFTGTPVTTGVPAPGQHREHPAWHGDDRRVPGRLPDRIRLGVPRHLPGQPVGPAGRAVQQRGARDRADRRVRQRVPPVQPGRRHRRGEQPARLLLRIQLGDVARREQGGAGRFPSDCLYGRDRAGRRDLKAWGGGRSWTSAFAGVPAGAPVAGHVHRHCLRRLGGGAVASGLRPRRAVAGTESRFAWKGAAMAWLLLSTGGAAREPIAAPADDGISS
jgi:hypothetical protein